MTRSLVAGLALWLLLPVAKADPAPGGSVSLGKAERLIEDLRYAAANVELDAASAALNDRPTLIRILWLKGMLGGLLNKPDAARTAFRALVSVAPEFKPAAGQPARVMTPWFEARGWLETNKPISFTRGAFEEDKASVYRVRILLESDALKLARAVRFHLREDSGEWRIVQTPLANPSVEIKGSKLEWWAELLGEHQAVLELLGEESAPLREATRVAAAEPVQAPPEPPPAALIPSPPAEPVPGVAASDAPAPGRSVRITGYVLVGAAVAATSVGAYFGVSSRSEAARITDPRRQSDGAVIGLTQREADRVSADSRMHATIANVLFVGGAVMAAGGVGLWFFGYRLSVRPAGAGVAVAGQFE